MNTQTLSRALRLVAVTAVVAMAAFVAACGSSGDGGAAAPGPASSAASSQPASPPASVAASAGASAGAALSTTPTSAPTSSAPAGSTGASAQAADEQTVKDEAAGASAVLRQFLEAVSTHDITAASSLTAADAVFQPEGLLDRARRITLDASSIQLVPDEEGLPHLALKGSGSAEVVARAGSDLSSGPYDLLVGLRRESRRDEWRVWSFDLQPR